MTRLDVVNARFPQWREFQARVEHLLDVGPGERSMFVENQAAPVFPEVLWHDLHLVAFNLGWSLGQLIGYLVVVGAMKVTEDARRGIPSL